MLERIGDSEFESDKFWIKKACKDPEHNPPSHICLKHGKYKHTCPACGKVTIFIVPAIPEVFVI